MGWYWLEVMFDVMVCGDDALSRVGVKQVVEWMVIWHMGGSECTIRMKDGSAWSSVITHEGCIKECGSRGVA